MMRVDDRASNGEVTTPVELAKEMIALIPEHILKSSSTTFLDPCIGNGTFIIELIKKLRSYGHSMENIQGRIYGCDLKDRFINKIQAKLAKYQFDNIIQGDSLKKNFMNKKFDVVIGNPPYQNGKQSIWQKFAMLGLDQLNEGGYLCFVHPATYRLRGNHKEINEYFDLMKSNYIVNLQLSNFQSSKKVFGEANTTADWYAICKEPANGRLTKVTDVNGNVSEIDLSDVVGIPDILDVDDDVVSLHDDTLDVIKGNNEFFSQNGKKEPDEEHTYPALYSLKQGGPNFLYFKNKPDRTKELAEGQKIVFANGCGKPVLDLDGAMGLTQFAYAITGEEDYLKKVYKAVCNPDCIKLIQALAVGDAHTYNFKSLRFLKKDFYKAFI